MSDFVEVHKSKALAILDALKMARATIASLEAKAAQDKLTIEALTFAFDGALSADGGESMGGDNRGLPVA